MKLRAGVPVRSLHTLHADGGAVQLLLRRWCDHGRSSMTLISMSWSKIWAGKGSNTWGSGRSGVMGYRMGLSHFRGDFSLVAVEDTSPHGP